MEGKEQRFGSSGRPLFASATTGTSTGAVNSMHDSYSALGGGVPLSSMLLGEVSPGGVGTGLYGLLVVVVLAVFIAGLMVGRTPELLGKTIGRAEVTSAALRRSRCRRSCSLGTGLAVVLPIASAPGSTTGPHGLSELLYAMASASNNNGSAFAGLRPTSRSSTCSSRCACSLGRFLPIILVLRLAGSLAAQGRRPVTAGTMPTHTPLFTTLVIGTVLVVAGLTFFPSLALGPIAEALS